MPSLWSWLPRRKDQSESSLGSSESNKKGRRPMKKLFSFGSKDEHVSRSRDASAGLRRHTVLNDDHAVYPHMAHRAHGMERAFDDDVDDGLKKLEDLLEGNNYSSKRPLAYEIFEDPNKPKPRKLRDENRPEFLSQPSLNHGYEPAHKSRDYYNPYHVQERIEVHDVEMRKKSPNIFAGLLSKAQRNSMQEEYPPQGRMPRTGMQPRRTESMYGYVPRAVSLHDASAVLFGQEKEEALSPSYQKTRMDNFAQRPAWNSRISEDVTELDSDFVPPVQNAPSRRERSISHDVDMRANYANGHASERELNAPAQRNKQVSQMKQATGNDNFYFSSSFLGDTPNTGHLDNNKFITPSNTTSTDNAHAKGKHKSSKNNHNHRNDNNINNNHHVSNNNNNSKTVVETNNGFWLSKTDIIGSDRQNDHTGRGGIRPDNRLKGKMDNENDVNSLLEHFDQLSGTDNAIRNDKQQLEGIFSTEGEVLY